MVLAQIQACVNIFSILQQNECCVDPVQLHFNDAS